MLIDDKLGCSWLIVWIFPRYNSWYHTESWGGCSEPLVQNVGFPPIFLLFRLLAGPILRTSNESFKFVVFSPLVSGFEKLYAAWCLTHAACMTWNSNSKMRMRQRTSLTDVSREVQYPAKPVVRRSILPSGAFQIWPRMWYGHSHSEMFLRFAVAAFCIVQGPHWISNRLV